MDIQAVLNSDIAMQFDECTPYETNGITTDEKTAKNSLELSLRWGERSIHRFRELNTGNALFGIVQGGMFEHLRDVSLDGVASQDFDGIAIGGLSVGEPKPEFERILSHIGPKLPENKPHYLMGVGTPEDLVLGVSQGIDMFDCVLPTRVARNGTAYTADGTINLKNARWEKSREPLAPPDSTHPLCDGFTLGYLRHLIKNEELLGLRLLTLHNLAFYLDLMKQVRRAIEDGSFADFKEGFIRRYRAGTADP